MGWWKRGKVRLESYAIFLWEQRRGSPLNGYDFQISGGGEDKQIIERGACGDGRGSFWLLIPHQLDRPTTVSFFRLSRDFTVLIVDNIRLGL
jgi:hypothetical protein